MGFIDTLTKNLGFNKEEPVVPTQRDIPAKQTTMTSRAFGQPSPLLTSISKAIKSEESQSSVTPKRDIPSTKELSKSVVSLIGDTLRAIPRSGATVGQTIKESLFSEPSDTGVKEIPQNKVSQFVFGKEPIRTVPKLVEKYKPDVKNIAEKLGASEKTSELISKYSTLPLVVGSIGLDLTGFGGGAKNVAKEGFEDFIKVAVKEEGESLLKETAKKLLKVTDEEATKIAKSVSPLKKEDEIRKILGVKKEVPDDLVNFSNKVSEQNLTKDDYLKQFSKDLENQNLTYRDRAQATKKMIEDTGYTVETFYDDLIKRSINNSVENTNKFRDEIYSGIHETKRLDTPENIDTFLNIKGTPDDTIIISRASTTPIKEGDFVVINDRANRYLDKREGAILHTKEVSVKDLVKSPGNPDEFVYAPKSATQQISETKALEQARGGLKDSIKERGYITSAKASEKIDDMIKSQISGEYTVKSNKGLIERATQRVANDIEEAKTLATSEATDEAIATGTSLMAHYGDEITQTTSKEAQLGLAKEAADIINKQAEILTEAGRTIQAASLIGKQTPEGLLMTTARKIKEYNKLNPTKKVPELTPKDVIEVLEKGKKIEAMSEGLAKEVAKKDLADTLKSLIPAPMWKKIVHIYKAGLLTGIGTHGVNVLSTFFNGVLESVKNLPATGIDLATAIVTGKRTKALVSPLKYMEGISEGAKKGWNYLKTGVESEAVETGLEKYKVHYDSKVGKLLGKYADSVYRVLGTEDTPFYYGALKRSLVEQGLVSIKNQKKVFASASEKSKYITDFINNPPDEVLELAQLDAKMATFKNDTALGKAASALQNTPVIGPALQMTVLPFAKTPSAVAMQMFNYTPAGLITTFYKGFLRGGFDQKEFAEGLGRVVTGTGALWLGSELWKKGKITLGYPKSEKERAQWEATGKTPNSILIKDKWVPLTTFGPAGNVMTIGGYFSKGVDDTGSIAGGVASGFAGGLQNLTEQTFLTGVKNAMDAINEPEKKGVSWIGNTLASVVPSIVNNINQSFDDYQRKSSGTILGPLKARLPGIRQTLPKKLDVWGQSLERNRSELGVALSPLRLSNTIEGTLNTEVERLGELGEDIRPTKVDAQIRNVKLTPEEHYKYQRIYGNHLTKGLIGLVKNPEYQKLDPEQQALEWKRTTKEIKKVVNERVLPELMKRRYELDDTINPELFTDAVNYYYKENPKFAKASPDKQKKFILKKIQ